MGARTAPASVAVTAPVGLYSLHSYVPLTGECRARADAGAAVARAGVAAVAHADVVAFARVGAGVYAHAGRDAVSTAQRYLHA